MSAFHHSIAFGPVKKKDLPEMSLVELAALYSEITGGDKIRPKSKEEAIRLLTEIKSKAYGVRRRERRFNLPYRGFIRRTRRTGTKKAALIGILTRPGGATIHECAVVTGWNYDNVYANIMLLHTLVGYGIEEDESTGKIRVHADAGPQV